MAKQDQSEQKYDFSHMRDDAEFQHNWLELRQGAERIKKVAPIAAVMFFLLITFLLYRSISTEQANIAPTMRHG